MAKQSTTTIVSRVRAVNRRLDARREEPRSADCALWGALALSTYARVTGNPDDLQTDPEAVLVDLLADLMHWCDNPEPRVIGEGAISFESALQRALRHYGEECLEERERPLAKRGLDRRRK